jgi:hypothetical protein
VSHYFKVDKVLDTVVLGEKWPWVAFRLHNVLDSAVALSNSSGATG